MSKTEALKNQGGAQRQSNERRSASLTGLAASSQPEPGQQGSTRRRATTTDDAESDKLVRVSVPKAFQYIGPDSVMHKFAAGEQNMRLKFAHASYAKAHGVTIIGEAE